MISRRVFITAIILCVTFVSFNVLYGSRITHPTEPNAFQAWNVFHYYTNAKYFDELGYTELYHCTARAMEDNEGFVRANQMVRNLETYELEKYAESAGQCDTTAFSKSRWGEFSDDLHTIVSLESDTFWVGVLKDKGFNPSPTWLFIGEPLTNHISIQNDLVAGIIHFDWVLLLASCVIVGLVISPRIAGVFGLFILLYFGMFYRLVGNYFQLMWLSSATLGIVAWYKERLKISGILFAFSGALRVFPYLFVVGIVIHNIVTYSRGGKSEFLAEYKNFWKWFLTSSGVFFILPFLVRPGVWFEFANKIVTHSAYLINETFHIGYRSFATEFLDTGTFIFLGVMLLSLYVVAVLRSTIFESIGISTILLYILLNASPYYGISTGLLLLTIAASSRFTKLIVVFLCFVLIEALLLFNPGVYTNLGYLADLSSEVIILMFNTAVLVFFVFRNKLEGIVLKKNTR